MNFDALIAGLETRVFGHRLYLFRETDSTNNLALRMGRHGEPEGSLIATDYQTAGRGRRGKQWLAPPGSSILASLIVRSRPAVDPDGSLAPRSLACHVQTWYTLLTALAIVEAIRRETGLIAQLKWPNDVWIQERKVCGILTECATDEQGKLFYVIGFGINVNIPKELFPLPVRKVATALNLLLGYELSREDLLQRCLLEMEERVTLLRQEGVEGLRRELHTRSLVIGRRVRVEATETQVEGVACGFDLDGSLLIRADNQRLHRLHSGSLQLMD